MSIIALSSLSTPLTLPRLSQSQGLLKITSHSLQYKFDSRDESQGGTNGTTAGANSAVYVLSLAFCSAILADLVSSL